MPSDTQYLHSRGFAATCSEADRETTFEPNSLPLSRPSSVPSDLTPAARFLFAIGRTKNLLHLFRHLGRRSRIFQQMLWVIQSRLLRLIRESCRQRLKILNEFQWQVVRCLAPNIRRRSLARDRRAENQRPSIRMPLRPGSAARCRETRSLRGKSSTPDSNIREARGTLSVRPLEIEEARERLTAHPLNGGIAPGKLSASASEIGKTPGRLSAPLCQTPDKTRHSGTLCKTTSCHLSPASPPPPRSNRMFTAQPPDRHAAMPN